jgi:hypothetical protein
MGKPTRSRFLKDFFGKNPAEIMSQEETITYNKQQIEKTAAKCDRVMKYLGSDGFKSSLGPDDGPKYIDKVTNIDFTNVTNLLKSSEPKKHLKSFKHLYENKRVYFV